MRVRQLTRVAAATAMAVAGLTAVLGAPSQAAPSSASSNENCGGAQVRTCASLQVDGHRFRPFANIKDVEGDGDFRVDLLKARVQVRTSTGAWLDYGPAFVDSPAGWHGEWDNLDPVASWQSCGGNARVFRTVALFAWDSYGSGYKEQWWPSLPTTVRCDQG